MIALLGAAVVLAGQPAVADHAAVTAAEGLAFNYYTDVSLFDGPSSRRGYGQVVCESENDPAGCVPATDEASAVSPSVECPQGGGSDRVTKPDGAQAEYGPATIFGGIWPEDAPSAPPSGPLTSEVDCELGEDGHASASTSVTLTPAGTTYPGGVGPGPLVAEEVHSSCTMTPHGVTSDVTIVGGVLETQYDADTGEPIETEAVPDSPDANLTRSGTLDHVGDSYRIVFNEQIENPDGSFTVNAARVELLGPSATGEMVIGSSTCGPLTTEAGPDPVEACPSEEVPPAPFSDRAAIPDAHRPNVDCAAWRDIVAGFPDGTYGPAVSVRRDQMASFIARTLTAAGVDLPPPIDEGFTDVEGGSVHDEAIHTLAVAGIVRGGPAGLPASSYGPGLQVRRDQMASFLVRAAEYATGETLASDAPAFTDVAAANPHYANVNGAAEMGLAQGVGGGMYRPADSVRRDQMATFVIRLLAALVEAGLMPA